MKNLHQKFKKLCHSCENRNPGSQHKTWIPNQVWDDTIRTNDNINNVIKNGFKSFTLIETMVALTIIMIAILGPVSVAVSASSYARDTKDNFTAVYLAQEAVELLRHKRDSLFLSCTNANCTLLNDNGFGTVETPKEGSWRIFKTQIGFDAPQGACWSVNGCYYDMQNFLSGNVYAKGVNPGCDTFYRDDNVGGNTNSMYSCTGGAGWTPTHFSRSVKLEDMTNGLNGYSAKYEDDIRVTVDVTYPKNNGLIKKVEVVDFIHSKS